MISYVMANLTKADYSEVITVMQQNGIANKTINELRLAVREISGKAGVETKAKMLTKEESLIATGNKFMRN
jgi:hypothetical protein